MKRLIYIVVLLVIFIAEGNSQQSPLYSQYMLNGFLLNPAVAGSEGYTAVNLTVREQWLGLTDGPATYALSFQTRLMQESQISRSKSVRKRGRSASRGGRVGLGGYIFNHRNGAVDRTGIKLTYAYHIDLESAQLSFGLSMVGYQYRLDENRIKLEIPDDDLWLGIHQSVFIPDADAGVYLSNADLWVGLSVDQLLEAAIKFGDDGYESFVMERTFNLMGGYDFMVNRDLTLSPSAYIKVTGSGKIQADISGRCYFRQDFWGGLTYRTGHSVVVMAGVRVDRLVFGYAYDIGLNGLMKHTYGTHEFSFAASFGDVASRHRWLNRF
jgi:type IX secretion system PorP/SprF family membrane protein